MLTYSSICLFGIFLGDLVLGIRLNDFVLDFEPLNYDPIEIQKAHSRLKRSIGQVEVEPRIYIKLISNKGSFKLKLWRDQITFGEHFQFLQNGKSDLFAQNFHLFHGEVEDVPGSSVYGSIRQGVFDGWISFGNETFYVEKTPSNSSSHHSVIYSVRDIDPRSLTSLSISPCSTDDALRTWMESIQNSKVSEMKEQFSKTPHMLEQNLHTDSYSLARDISRKKRQSSLRTTCMLHIRTDPMLWRHMATEHPNMDKSTISEEILSTVGQHVKAANDIFENTFFEGKVSYRNIQFVVQRVKIDTDEECAADYKGLPNPFCAENIDLSNFLDTHSRSNHDDFCLSYLFTYRDFSGGVVGLAWVASPDAAGPAGGICEKYSSYSDFKSNRSLNTGIVTFLNYNRKLPLRVSQLTFTHELGHNFGASHDPIDDNCQPGGKDGNYLMYSSATSGYLGNNDMFSSCSKKSIASVLDKITLTDPLQNCFEETQSAFCGNKIVEQGEECDCGFNQKECTDRCCHARRLGDEPENAGAKTSSYPNPQKCRRMPGAICSPSEGPCCASDCSYYPNSNHQLRLCQSETECTQAVYCTGRSPICPEPIHQPDNDTLCNNGTQVCLGGICRGSLCTKYGLGECLLTREGFEDLRSQSENLRSTLCTIACLGKDDDKCHPLSYFNLPDLKLRPGSPCDNFRGYCDVFQRCRTVDDKGPLLRLTKILFNRKTYRNVVEWIKGNPIWSGLIGCLGILLFALFVKCCAVHTPSSNPYLPHHLKFTETLQRPIRTLQRRPKGHHGSASDHEMEPLPARGRRNRNTSRPLPSDRASMVPYH